MYKSKKSPLGEALLIKSIIITFIILSINHVNIANSLLAVRSLSFYPDGNYVFCGFQNAMRYFFVIDTSSALTSAIGVGNGLSIQLTTLPFQLDAPQTQYVMWSYGSQIAVSISLYLANEGGESLSVPNYIFDCSSPIPDILQTSGSIVGSPYSNVYRMFSKFKIANIINGYFTCEVPGFICSMNLATASRSTPTFLFEIAANTTSPLISTTLIIKNKGTIIDTLDLNFSPVSTSSVSFNLLYQNQSILSPSQFSSTKLTAYLLNTFGDHIQIYTDKTYYQPERSISQYIPLLGTPMSAYSMLTFDFPNSAQTSTYSYSLTTQSNNKEIRRFTYSIDQSRLVALGTFRPMTTNPFLANWASYEIISSTTVYSVPGLKMNGQYLPYPYGCANDGFRAQMVFPPYYSGTFVTITAYQNYIYPSPLVKFTNWPSMTYPIPVGSSFAITNLTFTPIDSYSFIARLSAYNRDGFYKLTFTNGQAIRSYDIVSGTLNIGTYETEIKMPVLTTNPITREVLRLDDGAGNILYYGELSSYSSNKFIPALPFFSIDPLLINSFYFEPNNLDVTNGPANTTLYFSCDITTGRPRIEIIFRGYRTERESKENIFEGYFDPAKNKFVIPITLRQSLFTGSLQYILYNYPLSLTNEMIASVPAVGYNAYLNVSSVYADLMGPIISDFTRNNNPVVGASQYINYTFSIKDQFGFREGIVYLRYTNFPILMDKQKTISYNTRISGDEFTSVHQVIFPLDDINFNLTAKIELELYDRLGNRATSVQSFNDTEFGVDPFISYLNTPKMEELNTVILSSSSSTQLNSITPATINGMNELLTLTVDVGSDNRWVNFTFTVTTSNDAYNKALPIVYFNALDADVFSQTTTLITSPSQKVSVYLCTAQLPFGFGAESGGILVSIYGIFDKGGIVSGFGSDDLNKLSLPYYVKTIFSLPATGSPIILSTSELTPSGGLLTIRGKRLLSTNANTVARVSYNGNTFEIATLSMTTGPLLIINVAKPTLDHIVIQVTTITNSLPYTVYVKNETQRVVIPTLTPSPSNKPCPDCSVNGQCVDGTCVCNSGFSGPNCKSQIIITNPSHDPKKPTTIATDNFNFTTGVSVVEVREVDTFGKTIKSFMLSNWTLTNNTVDNYQYYSYLTKLDNTNGSYVQVDVYFYTKVTNVKFGNKNLTMQPYTVKYSIAITGYKFRDLLTTLQVILSADINLDGTGNDCLNTQTDGNGKNEITWIKMRINDKSLYGRFIDTGIIDGRDIRVSNVLLNENRNDTNTTTSAYYFIALNVPNFQTVALLDPDFSVLLDQDANECSSKSGLTTSQKIGIIVGSIAAFIVLATIFGFLIYKKMKYRIKVYFEDKMNNNSNDVELSKS